MHKYAPVHPERNVRLIVCNSHQRHLQLGSLSCELSLLGWMTQGYSANESEPPSNSCDRRSIVARDSSLSTTWEMKSGRGIGQKATGIVQSEGCQRRSSGRLNHVHRIPLTTYLVQHFFCKTTYKRGVCHRDIAIFLKDGYTL
jgi:hypothetical protein